jgi:archaellum biogenesis ATPase FlaH
MLDAQLLSAAIASRQSWDKIATHFGDKDFSPQGGFWLPIIREWYKRDPLAQSIDRSLLATQGELRITNPKHRETLLGFITDLPGAPSPENVVAVALELKRHNAGLELAAAIGQQDQNKIAELLPKFTAYQQATELHAGKLTEFQDAVPWEQLFEKVGQDKRIALAPQSLNQRIGGGALPGQHILVFGRPDSGKSTFVINLAAYLVYHGQRVLYLGNEDQIDILEARMLCRLSGMTFQEAEANKSKSIELARKRSGDRLLMTQMKHGTVSSIPAKLEAHRATVLILDQIKGLNNDEDGTTRQLERNARDMRTLILDHNLIGVSVSQANDRSAGYGQQPPIWLGMADVDSSRTGIPAQCDLMLGLGVNDELDSRGQRAVSIPKNKLSSAPDAHQGFIVEMDFARSKVT